MTTEIRNAKIESTMLGYEDHGILTGFLMMDYSGAGQGFGGWAIGECCGQYIKGILDCLNIARWEDIAGTYCRVDIQDGLIRGIGHITSDKWFYLKELTAHSD